MHSPYHCCAPVLFRCVRAPVLAVSSQMLRLSVRFTKRPCTMSSLASLIFSIPCLVHPIICSVAPHRLALSPRAPPLLLVARSSFFGKVTDSFEWKEHQGSTNISTLSSSPAVCGGGVESSPKAVYKASKAATGKGCWYLYVYPPPVCVCVCSEQPICTHYHHQ